MSCSPATLVKDTAGRQTQQEEKEQREKKGIDRRGLIAVCRCGGDEEEASAAARGGGQGKGGFDRFDFDSWMNRGPQRRLEGLFITCASVGCQGIQEGQPVEIKTMAGVGTGTGGKW